MTKELELFKEWFGVELSTSFNLKIELIHDSYLDITISCYDHTEIPAQYLRLLTASNYFINLKIKAIYDSIGACLSLNYRLPEWYGKEWEQYLKEKADE